MTTSFRRVHRGTPLALGILFIVGIPSTPSLTWGVGCTGAEPCAEPTLSNPTEVSISCNGLDDYFDLGEDAQGNSLPTSISGNRIVDFSESGAVCDVKNVIVIHQSNIIIKGSNNKFTSKSPGAPLPAVHDVFEIRGSNVHLEKMEILRAQQAIKIMPGATNISIDGVIIRGPSGAGIEIQSTASHVCVSGTMITGSDANGISVAAAHGDGGSLSLHDVTVTGSEDDGVSVSGTTSLSMNDVTIVQGSFNNNREDGVDLKLASGKNAKILCAEVSGNIGQGIKKFLPGELRVENVLVEGNGGPGIASEGSPTSVFSSTVIDNASPGDGRQIVASIGAIDTITVINTIGACSSAGCVLLSGASSSANCSHNLYSGTYGTGCTNGFMESPVLFGSGRFLKADGGGVSKGVDSGQTLSGLTLDEDRVGNMRPREGNNVSPAHFDMGAYETIFDSVVPPTATHTRTPTPTTDPNATATPTPVTPTATPTRTPSNTRTRTLTPAPTPPGGCDLGDCEPFDRCEANLCVGDCDNNCVVTINELITAVNIALGPIKATINACRNADRHDDDDVDVSIGELIQAVVNALTVCPQPMSGSLLARSFPVPQFSDRSLGLRLTDEPVASLRLIGSGKSFSLGLDSSGLAGWLQVDIQADLGDSGELACRLAERLDASIPIRVVKLDSTKARVVVGASPFGHLPGIRDGKLMRCSISSDSKQAKGSRQKPRIDRLVVRTRDGVIMPSSISAPE